MIQSPKVEPEVAGLLKRGQAIPAHPLALTESRRLDERSQRALTRYYVDAGAGGIAVGVHTTQFAIREPAHGLYRPVLELAMETAREWEARRGRRLIKVAGLSGPPGQTLSEAALASALGYDLGLLSLAAMGDAREDALIAHCKAVAEAIPLFGFYLQTSVGGRPLSFRFWRQLAEIPSLAAIKIAPFNRYQTIDVVRAVAEAGRSDDVALYTGNDDNIVVDLLTEYRFKVGERVVKQRIVGGLLGHWAVWTQKAVQLLNEVNEVVSSGTAIPLGLLSKAIAITDANAAFFDAANNFAGCIAGLHEVLRRQGLMQGTWCLDPEETLSPGQLEEIDRVYKAYPDLNDDDFVARHRDEWFA